MKIEQSGDDILVDGQKNEVKEFIRILRGISLTGELTSKHVCLLASNLTKLVRLPKGKVLHRMSLPQLSETFVPIITEIIPINYSGGIIQEKIDGNTGFLDLGTSRIYYRLKPNGSSVTFVVYPM